MCSNAIRNCVPLVLALAVTLHSCSIKEDRGECPCWLTLQVPSQGGSHLIVNWVLEASDTVREGILDDENNPSCTVEVPREKIRLVAVSGADGRPSWIQAVTACGTQSVCIRTTRMSTSGTTARTQVSPITFAATPAALTLMERLPRDRSGQRRTSRKGLTVALFRARETTPCAWTYILARN